ncbi:MAG: cytochrome-c oxidase [Verrucomicrobia bacterium]|nr:cytochrome-c oxidase [Verrucomicrobiota bacterium]
MRNHPSTLAAATTGPLQGRSHGLLLALFCLLVPFLCFLFWKQHQPPPVASEHGAGIDLMINYLLAAVGGLLLVGHAILAWFVWRFSRQDRVTFRLATVRTEWKWALVPVVLMLLVAEGGVLVFGVPVWKKFYVAKAPANALTVEVTGQQFVWHFRYPGKDGLFGRTHVKFIDDDNVLGLDPTDAAGRDDLIVNGQLRLPVNRPVRLRLRSKDVLHGFFLPSQRVRQDIVPGMLIEVWFVPNQAGQFEILCTELCGLGHHMMRGLLQVMPEREFEQWLNQNHS